MKPDNKQKPAAVSGFIRVFWKCNCPMLQTQQFGLHFVQLPFFFVCNHHFMQTTGPTVVAFLLHNITKLQKYFLFLMQFVSQALLPLYAPLEHNFPKMWSYLVNQNVEFFLLFFNFIFLLWKLDILKVH